MRRFLLTMSCAEIDGRYLARLLKEMLRRYGLKCEEITEIAPNEGDQECPKLKIRKPSSKSPSRSAD